MKEILVTAFKKNNETMLENVKVTIDRETGETHVYELLNVVKEVEDEKLERKETTKMSKKEKQEIMITIEKEMKKAAKNLDFERAMELRDILFEMKSED